MDSNQSSPEAAHSGTPTPIKLEMENMSDSYFPSLFELRYNSDDEDYEDYERGVIEVKFTLFPGYDMDMASLWLVYMVICT